jgi:hypothetical protein
MQESCRWPVSLAHLRETLGTRGTTCYADYSMESKNYAHSPGSEPDAAANSPGCHARCFLPPPFPHHAAVAPAGRVAELGVVRRLPRVLMNFIIRVFLPIIAATVAWLGVMTLTLMVFVFPALSLRTGFHWFLFCALIFTAVFGIYSLIYYYFVGRDPRRQAQVLIAAFAFLVLYLFIQSPAARNFIH